MVKSEIEFVSSRTFYGEQSISMIVNVSHRNTSQIKRKLYTNL